MADNNFLIPSVIEARNAYGLDDSDMAWFQLDGEPIQIQCYEDEDMQALLTDKCIAVGKPSASTTSKTQPCDSNVFKAPKTKIKKINDKKVEIDMHLQTHVADQIKNAMKEHILRTTEEARAVGNDTTETLSSIHRTHILHGLFRIQKSMKGVVGREIVQHAFRDCGIYPFDLDTICNLCDKPPTLAEQKVVESNLERLSGIYEEQGELFGEDLAALGIPFEGPHLLYTRDNLTMCRKRSVILTNNEVIRNQRERRKDKRRQEVLAVSRPLEAKERKLMRAEEVATKNHLGSLLRLEASELKLMRVEEAITKKVIRSHRKLEASELKLMRAEEAAMRKHR